MKRFVSKNEQIKISSLWTKTRGGLIADWKASKHHMKWNQEIMLFKIYFSKKFAKRLNVDENLKIKSQFMARIQSPLNAKF